MLKALGLPSGGVRTFLRKRWLVDGTLPYVTTTLTDVFHAEDDLLAAARARGCVGGRPSVVNYKLQHAARDMLPNPENSIETIAALLGVSVGALYNHVPDLKELRTSRFPAQVSGGSR